jgi:hypothetical protein
MIKIGWITSDTRKLVRAMYEPMLSKPALARRKIRDHHKDGLRASAIMNRLTDCVEGKVVLSTAQVQAAKVVLSKILPDLKTIDHIGDQSNVISGVTITIANQPTEKLIHDSSELTDSQGVRALTESISV